MSETLELSRRERRKLELRQRILDAATELFDAKGFAATTVDDICERADIAQKTFFNYYPSKQDLFRDLSVAGLESVLLDVETARKQGHTTRERLEAFFRVVAERTEEANATHRELLTDMVHAVHESSDNSAHARKLHDAFGALVQDGLVAGDVTKRHAPETLTEMILGAFYVLMFSYANVEDFPIRTQALAAAAFLADAFEPSAEE